MPDDKPWVQSGIYFSRGNFLGVVSSKTGDGKFEGRKNLCRRIVAALNACEGNSVEDLEKMFAAGETF
jgi:hypothetical protein